MRTVFWKEFRELGIVALVLTAPVVEGALGARPMSRHVSWMLVTGLILGTAHAALDRLQRRDSFYRHRPLSSMRFQIARGTVGAVAAVLPALAAHAVYVVRGPAARADAGDLAIAGAISLLGWATARSALTARGWLALPLIVLLPWVAHDVVDQTASAGLAAVVAAMLAAHATLRLSGETR